MEGLGTAKPYAKYKKKNNKYQNDTISPCCYSFLLGFFFFVLFSGIYVNNSTLTISEKTWIL